MNLVGHVAAAIDPAEPLPPPSFLVGCMLPDLAAIARVRIERPGGALGAGVEFHHAADAAFHKSDWFREMNRAARDALLDAGIGTGPARASSHAGVEMLLDGGLVADPVVALHARTALDAVHAAADDLAPLAPFEVRTIWVQRLRAIGSTLEPTRYRDPLFVAERVQRMTAGRTRIELPREDVDVVAGVLARFQPSIASAAPDVVAAVRRAVPSHLHPV